MEISANKIEKSIVHGKHKNVILKNVNLKISQGQIFTLFGKSGQGKTTLLNIICGLSKPDGGTIFYDDTDIFCLTDKEREVNLLKNIGYITQSKTLLPNLNIKENIYFINELRKNQIEKEWANYVIVNLQIERLMNQYPSELSGGEYQRVMIARNIIQNPEVIVADEPTSSLDEKNCEVVKQLFLELSIINKSIIVATHDKRFKDIATASYNLEQI